MALFSRRRKYASGDTPDAVETEPPAEAAKAQGGPDLPEQTEDPAAGGDVAGDGPSVRISVSSFRGVGAAPAPGPVPAGLAPDRAAGRSGPSPAPPNADAVPGIRDNVYVRDALAALSPSPEPAELLDVARQLLQGHLFVRVKGDARSLLAEGKPLPMAVATRGEKQFALLYSSGAALQRSMRASPDAAGSSVLAQPVQDILRSVLRGPYEGIVLDHESAPARAVLPRPLLERALDEGDPRLAVKALLAGPRTEATAAEVVEALREAPLWIAVKREAGGGPAGVAEARGKDGTRWLEVYSHPLELLALARGDTPLPVRAEQIAKALRGDDGLQGLILDPAGPWIRLERSSLVPLLPLAD